MTLYISQDDIFPSKLPTTLQTLQLSSYHITNNITFPLSLEMLIIEKPIVEHDNFQNDVDNLCSEIPYGCKIRFSDHEKKQFDRYCLINNVLYICSLFPQFTTIITYIPYYFGVGLELNLYLTFLGYLFIMTILVHIMVITVYTCYVKRYYDYLQYHRGKTCHFAWYQCGKLQFAHFIVCILYYYYVL